MRSFFPMLGLGHVFVCEGTDPFDMKGLVRLCRNAPGIVPTAQILYKFDKQSRLESFKDRICC